MKQFFIVKTPNGYTKVWISWAHRGAILENTDDIDANITRKSIRPDQLAYAIKEFESADIFRRRVHQYLRHLNLLIAFDITDTQTNSSVDHAWCQRATRISWEKVEIDNMMSWLSTLGGGFSSLGDEFTKCADLAGRISKYQLKLALRSGDPTIAVRCKLYYSISLIQKWKFHAAKQIILEQYEFAKEERLSGDERLYRMCHGIWLKLQQTSLEKRRLRFKGHQ